MTTKNKNVNQEITNDATDEDVLNATKKEVAAAIASAAALPLVDP